MTQKTKAQHQLKALADGTRLRVVNLLLHGEICGCDIGRVLRLSQPNVAQHLAYLRHAGVISSRRERNRVYYQLAEKFDPVLGGLLKTIRLVFDSDPVFVADTQRLEKAIQDGVCATQSALRGREGSKKARSRNPAANQAGRKVRGRGAGRASADGVAIALEALSPNREPQDPSRLPGSKSASHEMVETFPRLSEVMSCGHGERYASSSLAAGRAGPSTPG